MTEPAEYMKPLHEFARMLTGREQVALYEGFRFARDLALRESFEGKILRDKDGNETPLVYPPFKFTEMR